MTYIDNGHAWKAKRRRANSDNHDIDSVCIYCGAQKRYADPTQPCRLTPPKPVFGQITVTSVESGKNE